MSPSPASPSLPIRPSSTTPLDDPTHHAGFIHTPSGRPSARHRPLPSQRHPVSLSRHRSEPDIRSAVVQPAPHHPFPSSASFSAHRRASTASSDSSSDWDRGEESLRGAVPTQGLPPSPITARDQDTSPVGQYRSAFSNPFNEHFVATRSRSSGVVGIDSLHLETAQFPLGRSFSSSVPVTRPVVSEEEEHDTVPPDPSVSKTYAFVSLPGNAVRKRPRRRYDEIERLYHCSWSGCTKSYGTLNHLNAHIVMQRHGSKRSPSDFKELRKQWRKAKKDETEHPARPERGKDSFDMGSVQAALPKSHEWQPKPLPYGISQPYGPGIPGPEMDHRLADGQTMSRYPLSTEASSTYPKPLQQEYGHTISGAAHTTLPKQGSPTPGPAHLPAQAAYDYKRESRGQSWTPPSLPHFSRQTPSYNVSPSYTHQPQ